MVLQEARDHSDLSDAESDTWESVSEDGQQAGGPNLSADTAAELVISLLPCSPHAGAHAARPSLLIHTAPYAGPVSTGQALEDDGSTWETWDPRRCLFDNHLSESLEANLEYMWRNFHFTIPDTEYLRDAPGLLTYLVSTRALTGTQLCCWQELKRVGV